MTDEPDTTYTMTVDLSVLESLGINLYSNAAAVLSELVANAYDADAGTVSITWKPVTTTDTTPVSGVPFTNSQLMEVVVLDDGCGMTVKQLNDRFLKAGYKKRDSEGKMSLGKSRPFMGRKGIGKLSVFSLAKKIQVFSRVSDSESSGLEILVDDLENAIKEGRPYHPRPIPTDGTIETPTGTRLVLSELKSKRAGLTASALRKRLARRFDVIDQTPLEQGGFRIDVNGKQITWADRQELKKLEFIWEFGDNKLPDEVLPDGITRFALPSDVVDASQNWTVSGWFGTSRKPTDLTDDEEAGSLKNIIVLARKRPIQEGIIEKLDFSRLFGNYVTGQIEADFLDLDGDQYEDISTSDRQRLIEDDERVVALQTFLRRNFVVAADQWSAARPKKEAVNALARYPKLKEWVDSRPPWQQDSARTMIGTIASLDFERKNEAEDRAALFRSGILAFARVGLRQSSEDLAQLSQVTAIDLLPLLGQQDAYEAGLWVDILRSRVEAIDKLRSLTSEDQKEKVLQAHLFDHLWLLDPSWERATGSPAMEEDLRKVDPALFATDVDGQQIYGRIDIRYATSSGRHVIVELKRYSAAIDARKLAEQGTKYVDALASILRQQNREDEIQGIEVIFVLGRPPGAQGKGLSSDTEFYKSVFKPLNGRHVMYDELIVNARDQYQAYLDASAEARKLDELLAVLDAPETPDEASDQTSAGEGATDAVTPE